MSEWSIKSKNINLIDQIVEPNLVQKSISSFSLGDEQEEQKINNFEKSNLQYDSKISLSYEENLWDNLDEIQKQSQQGVRYLRDLINLSKSFLQSLNKFSHDVQKCEEQFLKETHSIHNNSIRSGLQNLVDNNYFSYAANKNQKKQQSHEQSLENNQKTKHVGKIQNSNNDESLSSLLNENDYVDVQKELKEMQEKEFIQLLQPLSIMKGNLRSIFKIIDDQASLIQGDLLEPLEMYLEHHENILKKQIEQARAIFSDYQDRVQNYQEYKRNYFNLSHESEQIEIEIEKALLSQQQGEVKVEVVQEIMNKSVNTKYKLQTANKNYKMSINDLNQTLFELQTEYKPILTQIQNYEESRINFTIHNFEKFYKHTSNLGKQLFEQGTVAQKMLTQLKETENLKEIIRHKMTGQSFPTEPYIFEEYQSSEDLLRYKQFLAQQSQEMKRDADTKLAEMLQQERKRQKVLDVFDSVIYHNGHYLVPSKTMLSELIVSFHDRETRMQVTELLKSICQKRCVVSYDGLKTLGELIKYLLTAIIHEKDVNFRVIYAILNASQLLYYQQRQGVKESGVLEKEQDTRFLLRQTKQYNRKYYLTNFINDHGIWQEESIWKNVLQKVLTQKFQEAVQKDKERRGDGESIGFSDDKNYEKPSSSAFMGNISYLGKTIKGVWGLGNKDGQKGEKDGKGDEDKKKTETMRISKVLAQNIIFNTISNFMFHFINFRYSLESSKDVILYFCKRYELDISRTHQLLSELESAQNSAVNSFTTKDLYDISRSKQQKRIRAANQKTNILILKLALKFIGTSPSQSSSNEILRKFLFLDKQTHKLLRKQVYKQALIYETDNLRARKKRVHLWKKLLGVEQDSKDYYALRDKVNSVSQFEDDGETYTAMTLNASVSGLIAMDVQRSFHNLRHIVKPEILNNILKTYAFFNPEIEYCQGMNFVAGFLFLVFRDEQLTFKALMRVAEIFDMSHLYQKELPKLKLFFYQLDRLVANELPQLHAHFKDESINSGIFASAWFITQFTNSLQAHDAKLAAKLQLKNRSNEDPDQESPISDNLLQLWDYFVSSGWKAVFKMGFYILKLNEDRLLQYSFEEILSLISDQSKVLLAGDCNHLDEIERELLSPSYLKDKTLNSTSGGNSSKNQTESVMTFSDIEEVKTEIPQQQFELGEQISMFMRFKRSLDVDSEGRPLHLGFLLEKFKNEFDSQSKLSESRKYASINAKGQKQQI